MKYHAYQARTAWEIVRDMFLGTRRPGVPGPNPSDVDKIVIALRAAVIAEIELAKVQCETERAALAVDRASAIKSDLSVDQYRPPEITIKRVPIT